MNLTYLLVFVFAIVLVGIVASPIGAVVLLIVGGVVIGGVVVAGARKVEDSENKTRDQLEREPPETGPWGEAKDPSDIGKTESGSSQPS